MKREHSHLCPNPGTDIKSKLWQEDDESTQDNIDGMDNLLVVLGYKMKSSDLEKPWSMSKVAPLNSPQKLFITTQYVHYLIVFLRFAKLVVHLKNMSAVMQSG